MSYKNNRFSSDRENQNKFDWKRIGFNLIDIRLPEVNAVYYCLRADNTRKKTHRLTGIYTQLYKPELRSIENERFSEELKNPHRLVSFEARVFALTQDYNTAYMNGYSYTRVVDSLSSRKHKHRLRREKTRT